VFRGLKSTFADKRVYLFLLMGISGLFAFAIFYSFVPTKAELIGLQAWHIGLILGTGAVIFSIISYTIGALSDKFGRRTFAIVSQVLLVIAGLGLIYSHSFVTLLVFYGLFCIAETTTFLLSFVYAAEIFDKKYIGTSMGAFDSMMDLSLFIAPLVAICVYK